MADDNIPINPKDKRETKLIQSARDEGVEEGKRLGRGEILEFLQRQYMDPGRPDRGSPEAKAILEVTRNIMRNFKDKP